MTISTRDEQITIPDGELGAHIAIPESGSGPGILLLHEIFGVNVYVEDNARRLAELGYVVLAPDLFWRVLPGHRIDVHDEDGVKAGMAAVSQLDVPTAGRDAVAALGLLRALPEVSDRRAGVLGFCLGGTLSYLVAVHGDPDAAVVYYGSGIADMLDAAAKIECPMLMHWGGADQFIPREQVDAVAATAADNDRIEFHVYEGAGHAFDNHRSDQFHHPEAAARAWERTAAFLTRELPPG
jgi:carboxymethylenebutenolidase